MRYRILKSQICGATLTDSNLEYIGSITVDQNHLESCGILPNEQVHVWNNTSGTRLVTYALEGPAGSGVFCINGAGAHLFSVGDNITVSAFLETEKIPAGYRPRIVFLSRTKTEQDCGHVCDPVEEVSG